MSESKKPLVKQPTPKPTRKVTAGLMGTQVAAVALGVWAIFHPDSYARIPPGFEASFGAVLGGLLGFVSAWIAKDRLT